MACRESAGFTLLEVLIALVLLSVFTVTSYRALDAVLTAERHARAEMVRWQNLAVVFAGIESDLQDAVAASIPLAAGRPGFRAERDDSGAAEFSLDRQLPADHTEGLMRIFYRYADGRLTRSSLSLLRQTPEPIEAELLDGLASVEFRYLDGVGVWQPAWGAVQFGQLPRAVAMVLAWPDGRHLRRVFRLQ